MSKLKVSSTFATEIADVDKLRFNEAVASGLYPCAPATKAGAVRYFDLNDIIVLTVYRHLLHEGTLPRSAGPMACGLLDLLRQFPEAERVVWVKSSMGSDGWFLVKDFDRDAEIMPGGTDVVSFREWRLKFMRERISFKMEESAKLIAHPADKTAEETSTYGTED